MRLTHSVAFARIAALSLLLLTPCFWHSRIQAGDLSSHVYNAWLVRLAEERPVPGLIIVPQHSNVLFDLMLSYGMRYYGAGKAQAIAVAACVLVFFWGSFVFVRAACGRTAWWISPCLAMLTYGWAFHMGFFNFVLSLGLCLFAIAAWLTGLDIARAAALLLLFLAWTAHSLPVLWAIGIVIALHLAARYPRIFFVAGVVALIAMRFAIASRYPIYWTLAQISSMTGADQFIVFGFAYGMVAAAALFLGLTTIWLRTRRRALPALLKSPETQVLGLLSLAILIMLESIQVPEYRVGLGYLSQRMSLTVGIMACVVLARGPVVRWQAASWWIVMAVYGAMLYADTGKFNRLEDSVTAQLSAIEPWQRVIIAAGTPDTRVNLLTHMVDRACIERCFSYANYQPSTLAFRLRTIAPNYVVTANYNDSYAMQMGNYIVKADDRLFLQVNICPEGRVILMRLHQGQLAGHPYCPGT